MASLSRFFKQGKAFVFTAVLTAFMLPVTKKGIQVPIALMVVAWLLSPKVHSRGAWLGVLLLSSLYLAHMAGMLYTENVPRGMRDLEQKLGLLLFPMLFATAAPVGAKQGRQVFAAFGAGVMVAIVYAFGESWLKYLHTGDVLSFYMSEFSHVHHPGYLALYICVSLAALFFYTGREGAKGSAALLLLSVPAVVALVFAASKTGTILLACLVLYWLVYAFRQMALWRWHTGAVLLVAVFFAIYTIHDPVLKTQITTSVQIAAGQTDEPVREIESTQARIIAWSAAWELMKQHPLGVGTGDVNDAFVQRFREQGYHELADMELNPHNNYLQIGVALGWPGLALWLLTLLICTWRAWQKKDWIYGYFILAIALHMLTESILEKQSGLVFLAFFNAWLYFGESPFPERNQNLKANKSE
jgi:O-antigen ligase